MNSSVRNLVLWVVVLGLVGLVFAVIKNTKPTGAHPDFSVLVRDVKDGKVEKITLNSVTGDVHGKYKNGDEFTSTVPHTYNDFTTLLIDKGVTINVEKDAGGNWVSLLMNAIPFVLLVGFWVFMMRQMQSGGNKALSFGKSRARLHSSQQKKVTFKDVAGVEEAKEELQEIIEFLREPQKFQKLGGRIPKGVLLVGSPGTGKTLLARAIAGEANVPFFSISGSDFVEMFVGVGASRVRDLFEQGKKNAPCIIFIDEIDAVGRHRGAGLGGGHDEREQTLNQLLVEMDGFESNEGVILVAATNRPDVLDPALLRPGRFDRRVVVGRPDLKGREADPQSPHQESAPGRRRQPHDHRPRHPRIRRRRSGQPGQRSSASSRPPESQSCHAVRFRTRQGQSDHGRRTPQPDPQRRRKEEHRLSRSRTRAGSGAHAQRRSAA